MSAFDHLLDLLAEEANASLGLETQAELDRLRAETLPDSLPDFESAAAACHVGWVGKLEPMPSGLMERLQRQATEVTGAATAGPSAETRQAAPEAQGPPGAKVTQHPSVPRTAGASEPSTLAGPGGASSPTKAPLWAVPAAAAAVLAGSFALWSYTRQVDLAQELSVAEAALAEIQDAASPTAREGLDELLASAGESLLRKPFAPGPDASGAEVQGELVWSTERQEGYMRLQGLASNDAGKEQYQLWIFDAQRPEATPVDGGVFDIPVGGEVIVPIDAKVQVFEPGLFAVTVEAPGGVVVSKRERIAVLGNT